MNTAHTASDESAEPRLLKIRVNGVELAYFERGAPSPDRPTLLFVHATGFHARVFDRIIESFPGYHILALDQRGHGRSEKVLIEHWQTMGEDMAAFVTALGLQNLIGVGHSMGGHAMVDAAAKTGAFARLVLLDPTIASPEAYAEARNRVGEGGQHPAAKRKRHFDSWQEMVERLRPKGSYHVFEPRIFEDYCRYGLLPAAGGGYELACPPEVEASVYMTSRTNGAVHESARALRIPVTVIRAREPSGAIDPMNFSVSPTWPGLAGEMQNARDMHLRECTHFIPMQVPDLVVDVIREEVAAWLAEPSG